MIKIRRSILLLVGSVLLLSCGEGVVEQNTLDPENTPTQVSHNHRVLETKNGKPSFRLTTPLIEKFDEAKEPYWQFPQGVKAEGYQAESDSIESEIVADYARYDVNKDLWEARGNVVVTNFKDDRILYTDQLFWDRKLAKIYTDKPARILDKGNTHRGVGFSADEKFKSWQFYKGKGRLEVDDLKKDSTGQSTDSLSSGVDSVTTSTRPSTAQTVKPTAAKSEPVKPSAKLRPDIRPETDIPKPRRK